MDPLRTCLRVLGVCFVVLGLSSAAVGSTEAQDRGVPRFGSLVDSDTVVAGSFDRGRLWSLAQPPLDYFEDQYGVRADERGLRHARLGTVRLPECSGALVSPNGLVLTAARCVRSFRMGDTDSARAASFYAETREQERSLSGLYAERVVDVRDVTTQVDSVQEAGQPRVQEQMQQKAPDDHRVEVVPEGGGTRFVAYTYRRIEDVRLAFMPDRDVTVHGRLGETLTYPQHAWDVAVLRLYTDDGPLQTPRHLELRTQGARPGDAVFAVAHPPSVQRAETHDQLAFHRDVQLPVRVAALDAWTTRLQRYVDSASAPGVWADRRGEARSASRQSRARLESLQNDYLRARLRKRDENLQQDVAADSALHDKVRGLFERLAALQSEKRAYADQYRAFWLLLHPEYSSSTLRRALLAYRMQKEENTSSNSELETALQSVPSQPMALDAAAMGAHGRRLQNHLAPDSTLARRLQALDSASSIVQASLFSDSSRTQARLQEGSVPEDDPAVELVSAFYDRYADFEAEWSSLRERERRLTDSLARVRRRAAEMPVALPQDRTPRIADGRIRGYRYNGTHAPPFTTFYGLYGQHFSHRPDTTTALPSRWQSPPASFARSTLLVTAANTDLGGGAYGGPLLNTSLQLVGVVFGGNAQSAAGHYLFLPRRMRTVAADVRGVLEGLSEIYEAERLVQEMTGNPVSQ